MWSALGAAVGLMLIVVALAWLSAREERKEPKPYYSRDDQIDHDDELYAAQEGDMVILHDSMRNVVATGKVGKKTCASCSGSECGC